LFFVIVNIDLEKKSSVPERRTTPFPGKIWPVHNRLTKISIRKMTNTDFIKWNKRGKDLRETIGYVISRTLYVLYNKYSHKYEMFKELLITPKYLKEK
jgi:hypothetical protein